MTTSNDPCELDLPQQWPTLCDFTPIPTLPHHQMTSCANLTSVPFHATDAGRPAQDETTVERHFHCQAYNAIAWQALAPPEEQRNPDREDARRHREVHKIVHEAAERIKNSRASGTPILVGQPQEHRIWCSLVRWMDLVHGCH